MIWRGPLIPTCLTCPDDNFRKVATVELSQGARYAAMDLFKRCDTKSSRSSFCSGKLPEISPETDVETIWRFWSTKTMVPSWILKLQPAVSTRSTEDFRLTFKLLRMREQKAREEMKWGSRVPKEPTPLEVKLWRIRLGYSKKQRKLSSTVPESDPPAGAIRVSESTHNAYITLEVSQTKPNICHVIQKLTPKPPRCKTT